MPKKSKGEKDPKNKKDKSGKKADDSSNSKVEQDILQNVSNSKIEKDILNESNSMIIEDDFPEDFAIPAERSRGISVAMNDKIKQLQQSAEEHNRQTTSKPADLPAGLVSKAKEGLKKAAETEHKSLQDDPSKYIAHGLVSAAKLKFSGLGAIPLYPSLADYRRKNTLTSLSQSAQNVKVSDKQISLIISNLLHKQELVRRSRFMQHSHSILDFFHYDFKNPNILKLHLEGGSFIISNSDCKLFTTSVAATFNDILRLIEVGGGPTLTLFILQVLISDSPSSMISFSDLTTVVQIIASNIQGKSSKLSDIKASLSPSAEKALSSFLSSSHFTAASSEWRAILNEPESNSNSTDPEKSKKVKSLGEIITEQIHMTPYLIKILNSLAHLTEIKSIEPNKIANSPQHAFHFTYDDIEEIIVGGLGPVTAAKYLDEIAQKSIIFSSSQELSQTLAIMALPVTLYSAITSDILIDDNINPYNLLTACTDYALSSCDISEDIVQFMIDHVRFQSDSHGSKLIILSEPPEPDDLIIMEISDSDTPGLFTQKEDLSISQDFSIEHISMEDDSLNTIPKEVNSSIPEKPKSAYHRPSYSQLFSESFNPFTEFDADLAEFNDSNIDLENGNNLPRSKSPGTLVYEEALNVLASQGIDITGLEVDWY